MSGEPEHIRIPWKPIEPLPEEEQGANGALAGLDALRDEWARRLSSLAEEERVARRQRSLRRFAVETGIIERIYDVDWGLTLTLVAEGFAKDVVERAGGRIDDWTLATLRAHMDSIRLVEEFLQSERPLSPFFIRELHQSITRTQDTYFARDTLGRVTEVPLPKGEWKRLPNHVERADGRVLEYCPPEHVQTEIERLVGLWHELEKQSVHAVIKTAWLHHRFVQIHPFADGNGRVARALMLLVLEKNRYAPLVIDRWHRSEYLQALDTANDGDLRPLVKLLARLESTAFTSELEQPEPSHAGALSLDVAHTLAAQLAELRRRRELELQGKLRARALAVSGRIRHWFSSKAGEIEKILREKGLMDVWVRADEGGEEKGYWFKHQIVKAARAAGHHANLPTGARWFSLRIRTEGMRLRYVASLHGAGRDIGVMAVVTFGEIEVIDAEEQGDESAAREYLYTTKDAFRIVHSETIEEIEVRTRELEELLDEGLAEALAQFTRRL